MKFIADFHLHSKYSRATSSQMNLEDMANWTEIKGINILGTGDFTHPEWFQSLKENLESAESGLYKLKSQDETRFVLTSEISCVYSKNNAVRKIHVIIFAPSLEIVEKINTQLGWIGNIKSDGRPILGLDAKELTKIVLNISEDCLIVPAHAMTPWFGIFGSKSGFDSIEECFEDYSKYIYAIETGLSADPAMLWRIPDGRRVTLISNSDAHSPAKLGREANVFEGENIDYFSIVNAIKNRGLSSGGGQTSVKLAYTIEFYPEEGKYHYDGHRNCDISLSPAESRKYNNICPCCGKPLTVGVLSRIEELADKPENFKPDNFIPYKSLVPLEEIIAESLGQSTGTKQVELEYKNLIEKFNNEFNVLLNVSLSDLAENSLPEIAEGIKRVREGKVNVEPGYDGLFGKVRIFSQIEKKKTPNQKTLF